MQEKDRRARLTNQQRLRELKRHHGRAVQIVSSHDTVEFESLAHRRLADPPPGVAAAAHPM